jgi:glutamine---fructose-6-phosphate transaminase (isomerizing)
LPHPERRVRTAVFKRIDMCGIVGISSRKEFSSRVLLTRLQRLEYRGYDSYGFRLGSTTLKSVGGIRVEAGGRGGLGISHTRWATHGGVSERNAHPLLSCDGRVAIVHNGIIENHEELRRELVRKGHRFAGETDSEVIAHLIEEGLRNAPMPRVLVGLFRKLVGTFAVLVTVDGQEEMYAMKRDSPLALGIGGGRTFVASDIYAFSDVTDRAVFFENDEFAVIRAGDYHFFDKRGRPVAKRACRFSRERGTRPRRGSGHHMLREIREEPEAVRRLLFSLDHDQKKAFDALIGLIRRSRKVIFASCGTSYHASLLGSYFLHRAGVECQTLIASEFRHFADVDPDTLVIALSQSGETMDVIDALKYAAGRGGRIAALVNVPHSTIQRMSGLTLNILAGREICVASTKAFINQAVFLLMIARRFGFRVDATDIPAKIKAVFRRRATLKAIAEEIARSRDLYIIGRGLTYPVARETALKIKETSYIHAEGMMGGELKHGTLALIEEGTPVISLINNSDPDIISNTREVEARGAKAFIITNNPALRREKAAISIATGNDGKFGILAAVAGQLIAYYAAAYLGRPIDKPRNLAKSVTVK